MKHLIIGSGPAGVVATVGVHPHDASHATDALLADLERLGQYQLQLRLRWRNATQEARPLEGAQLLLCHEGGWFTPAGMFLLAPAVYISGYAVQDYREIDRVPAHRPVRQQAGGSRPGDGQQQPEQDQDRPRNQWPPVGAPFV